MLENLGPQGLEDVCAGDGREVKSIGVHTLAAGTIIVVRTLNGSPFVFEVVDPKVPLVHMSRAEGPSKLRLGYHGARWISGNINVDLRIYFNRPDRSLRINGKTGVVTSIKIIDPPPPTAEAEEKAETGAAEALKNL